MRPCVELYYSSSTQHIDGSPRLYFEPFIWCLSSFANALPWEAGTTSIERTTLLLHSLDEGLSMIAHTRSPIVIASPKHKWMSGIQISKKRGKTRLATSSSFVVGGGGGGLKR